MRDLHNHDHNRYTKLHFQHVHNSDYIRYENLRSGGDAELCYGQR